MKKRGGVVFQHGTPGPMSMIFLTAILLVFRRKDLCEAKHDLGVRKMCSKTMLCPHYATLWGGGQVKCSVVNMNAIE